MELQGQTKDGITWIHLQQVGKVKAKPAIEFQPGEMMAWNGGEITEVIEMVSETAKTITFSLKSETFHNLNPITNRRFKKDRLVAIGAN